MKTKEMLEWFKAYEANLDKCIFKCAGCGKDFMVLNAHPDASYAFCGTCKN